MNSNEKRTLADVRVDQNNLYREETFTDLKVGTIRRLMPVRSDGSPDETRRPIFTGQTQVMSSMGPVPVQCPIEGPGTQAGGGIVPPGGGILRG